MNLKYLEISSSSRTNVRNTANTDFTVFCCLNYLSFYLGTNLSCRNGISTSAILGASYLKITQLRLLALSRLYICLSVYPHATTRKPQIEFSLYLILGRFTKNVHTIQFWYDRILMTDTFLHTGDWVGNPSATLFNAFLKTC